jgi:hypothetical protein
MLLLLAASLCAWLCGEGLADAAAAAAGIIPPPPSVLEPNAGHAGRVSCAASSARRGGEGDV